MRLESFTLAPLRCKSLASAGAPRALSLHPCRPHAAKGMFGRAGVTKNLGAAARARKASVNRARGASIAEDGLPAGELSPAPAAL